MNKSEDYLDQLLKGMSDSRQDEIEAELKKELEEETEEEVFQDDILEEDVSEEDLFEVDEEFLKEFELEMQKLETDSENPADDAEKEASENDDTWDATDLDQILSGAKEQMEALEEETEETPMEVPLTEEPIVDEPAEEESISEEPINEEPLPEEPKEDEDVLKILEGLGDINLEEEMEAESAPEAETETESAQVEELSEDNISLLKELDDIGSSEEAAPEEDAGKKKEKKKKEKKEKKPKPKKEKKPKPKKEKKPKPPKVPDNTPPLPKKPVFMIFLLVASVVALIMVGTNLFGYANHLKDAKNAYSKKHYSETFSYVSGLEMKKKDEEIYHKYQVMALVSSELEAYESFMDAKLYDLALDFPVRTV